uniref:Glycoprotein-N-acetylgalactosamine 3-beta-galactosyltransferase 1 n=1 Tax=Acrobeloides nanus TaxID=290746 RepID=A0A914EDG4_9BILA
MREFLKKYNPKEPHFFGARFKMYLKNGYNSGAGMIFSYETVRLLNEALNKDSNFCEYHTYEDLGIAQCLAKLNIFPEKTTDENGKHRFLPYNFQEMYYNTLDAPGWLKDPIGKGFDIFSPSLVQLHHVQPNDMLLIEAMLYKVRNASDC